MKNILNSHTSTPLDHQEFDNPVTYRTTHSRAAKRPKLSTLFVRSIQSNWHNMERLATIAAVVGSFALGFPVTTVHAMADPLMGHPSGSPQIGIEIGAPVVEPICSYGYYGYAPYACAPYGYWGPEFFFGGHFRGAGPWEGQGRGYNRSRGERHYQVVMRQEGHQVHGQEYGKSPGMGSRGAGEGQGDHGEQGGDHGDHR